MDDIKLLGLQRAEFQRAERMNLNGNKVKVAIVFLSAISIVTKVELISYLFAVTNLIMAIVWIYLSYQAKRSHCTAERARRAVVFNNGLGIKLGRKSYTDLMMSFKVSEEDGRKHEDNFYFNTSQPYGEKKLSAIVEESSFWSKHLFQKSATRYWIYFGIALTISIVGLLLIPLLNIGNSKLLISQVFCLVITWLITGNLFTTSLAFTEAARSSDNIESRLASMAAAGESDEDILVIVGDYNALVGNPPTIPSNIYQKNRDKLNLLWEERKRLIEKSI